MKRLLIVLLVVTLVGWSLAVHKRRAASDSEYREARSHWAHSSQARRDVQRAAEEARRDAQRAAAEARRALREARDEAQRAMREAGRDIRDAFHEVRDAWTEAGAEVRQAGFKDSQEPRESVADIPVPIVPGTRTVEAVPVPPRPPQTPEAPEAPASPGFPGLAHEVPPPRPPAPPRAPRSQPTSAGPDRWVVGLVAVTEERAQDEARKRLEQEIADWLESHDIPRSWTPPSRLIDGMIRENKLARIDKEYGTVYEARIRPDFSAERLAFFRKSYQDHVVRGRLVLLGSLLAFVLTCLAGLAGYIRADEATRGYYTNRLRMLAAVGVGAAGGAIYHWIA